VVKQGHTERFRRECAALRAGRPRRPRRAPPEAGRAFPRPPHAPRRLGVSPPRAAPDRTLVAPDRPVRLLFPLRCAPTKVAVVLRLVLMVRSLRNTRQLLYLRLPRSPLREHAAPRAWLGRRSTLAAATAEPRLR
jgi:hypothetical protein